MFDPLIDDILAAPDDDGPRQVYADSLTERGDPRGEFITLQLKLAHADANDLRVPARARIEERLAKLLEEHRHEWTADFAEFTAAQFELRRGFVEHVTTSADLSGVVARLFSVGLLLRSATLASRAMNLVRTQEARRFETLRLVGPAIDGEWLRVVAAALRNGALRAIDFENPVAAPSEIADWPVPVAHLGVIHAQLQRWRRRAEFVERFSGVPARAALRSLRVRNLGLDRAEIDLPQLERLVVENCSLGAAEGSLARFVTSLPALTELSITQDTVSTSDVEAIVAACPRLRRVTLCEVGLSSGPPIDALVKLADLRRLDLRRNPLGQSALRRLLRAELPNIVAITLPRVVLDEKTTKQLRARFPGAEIYQA